MDFKTFQDMIETPGTYKFVKVNGTLRFIELNPFALRRHNEMLQPGETATAAGTIHTLDKGWKMADPYSTSLHIGCDAQTEEEIEAEFKKLDFPYQEAS